jgi:myo-inositol 2-dehydrogenase/D-chiro-inositol 1-dehydrogenase
VENGTPPSPSGDDGLKALLLADAATISAKEGRAVTV